MTGLIDRMNRALRWLPTWVIYMAGLAHVMWLFWLGQTGGLGVEPINRLEHELGEVGLKLIVFGLMVTPLRRFVGLNLLRFRRAIGLVAFFYILVHLLVWLVLDVYFLADIWADIVKRPYITVGMAGFAALLPLAITSNTLSVRRMGAASWRKLHRLTYVAAILAAVHFVMLVRGFPIGPLIYLVLVCALLLMRMKRRPQMSRANPPH